MGILPTNHQHGFALLAGLLIMALLMALGFLSLHLAGHQLIVSRTSQNDSSARYMAEAATEFVLQWFHDPGSAPTGLSRALFTKTITLPNTGPSFFDAQGRSQFSGTDSTPDVVFDATRPADNRLLNDPTTGWFAKINNFGRILTLKVYGPLRTGLLATVEVTAEKSGLSKTIVVQVGARTIPSLRAGVQIGLRHDLSNETPGGVPLLLWAHWGDVLVGGNVLFGKASDIPIHDTFAAVTGQSYAGMSPREDRWLEYWVGGAAQVIPSFVGAPSPLLSHIHDNQDPIPGLQFDRWDYHIMKEQARLFGTYYLLGKDGLLYGQGGVSSGKGQDPDRVFESQAVGDHKGFVFIDTLDQQPPHPGNVGVLTLNTSYAEGFFVINAHVHWNVSGQGTVVSALSPPVPGVISLGGRIKTQLSGVNLQGVFYVLGDVVMTGNPKIYGGLFVGGHLVRNDATQDPVEVWYNHDLKSGLVQGMPLVYLAPGTWQERL